MGSNMRAFPLLRPVALLGAGQRYEPQRQQHALLIFIPLRQRRDCAGQARSVSPRGEAATAAERPQHDVAGRTIRPVQDARTEIALTRRRPWMALGAPRAGTRTRAAGAVVGVGFLGFHVFADQRMEPAPRQRQRRGTRESCRAPRQSEILRDAQDDKSRRQQHGTGQPCEVHGKSDRPRQRQRPMRTVPRQRASAARRSRPTRRSPHRARSASPAGAGRRHPARVCNPAPTTPGVARGSGNPRC